MSKVTVTKRKVNLPSVSGLNEVWIRNIDVVDNIDLLAGKGDPWERFGSKIFREIVDFVEGRGKRILEQENYKFYMFTWIHISNSGNTQIGHNLQGEWREKGENFEDGARDFIHKLIEHFNHYDWTTIKGKIILETQGFSDNLIQIQKNHVEASYSSWTKYFKKFLVINKSSKGNCLFKHVWMLHIFYTTQNKVAALTATPRSDIGKASKFKTKLISKFGERLNGLDLKSIDMIPFIQEYFHTVTLKDYGFIVYSPRFEVEKTYEPLRDKDDLKRTVKWIRLRKVKNHIMGLVDRSDLTESELKELYQSDEFSENKLQEELHGDEKVYYVKGIDDYVMNGKTFTKSSLELELFKKDSYNLEWKKIDPYRNLVKSTELNLIGSLDLETFNTKDGVQAYLAGIDWENKDKLDPHEGLPVIESATFEGLDCIQQFIKYLEDNVVAMSGMIIYAHNGGKFDYYPILKGFLLSKSKILKPVANSALFVNGAIISLSVKAVLSGKEYSIHFKDSVRVLPGSLKDLGKSMKSPVQKMEVEGIEFVTEQNWKSEISKFRDYHKKDIECLFWVMKIYQDKFFKMTCNEEGKGIDITNCLTTSQSSLSYLLTYLPKDTNYRLKSPPKILDHLIRNFYRGGITEAKFIGRITPATFEDSFGFTQHPLRIIYGDFNSLYPYKMTFPLPLGESRVYTLKTGSLYYDTYEDGSHTFSNYKFTGLVHCKVWQENYENAKHFTQIASYHNGTRLYFPFFDEKYETLLDAEEIRQMLAQPELGYKFEFINFIWFTEKPFLKSFVEKFNNYKQECIENGDSAGKNIAKLIMNGAYGVFALNIFKDIIKLYEGTDYYTSLESWLSGNLMDINVIGDYILTKEKGEIKSRAANVQLSSKITATSRLMEQGFQYQATLEGHMVLYMDTDSTIFIINPEMSTQDFLKSKTYQHFIGGQRGDLGKMKDEMWGIAKGKLSKEDFESYLDLYDLKPDDGLFPIDQITIIAAKGYYCNSSLHPEVEKGALKGCKMKDEKMTFKKFDDAFSKDSEQKLRTNQTVFHSGIPSLFSEKNPLHVKITQEPKTFRPIYLKGVIEGVDENGDIAYIYPWKISEIWKQDGKKKEYPIQEVLDLFLKEQEDKIKL
jgi:hypothetical protein